MIINAFSHLYLDYIYICIYILPCCVRYQVHLPHPSYLKFAKSRCHKSQEKGSEEKNGEAAAFEWSCCKAQFYLLLQFIKCFRYSEKFQLALTYSHKKDDKLQQYEP